MALKWFLDVGYAGLRVVGRVYQLPAPDNPGKGVRPAAKWKAVGMRDVWDDTALGEHSTRAEAMKCIEDWWRELTVVKLPVKPEKTACSNHSKYRADCQACQKASGVNG